MSAAPFDVAVDTSRAIAYVTNTSGGSVSVIDESTGIVTATVGVGGPPNSVAVDMGRHSAFVTTGGHSVAVLSGLRPRVTSTVGAGSGAAGVAVDHVTHHILVTDAGAKKVSVINRH